jgi:hypothetical protein
MWYESLNPNVVESLKAIATSMHMRSLRDYENLEAFLAWLVHCTKTGTGKNFGERGIKNERDN